MTLGTILFLILGLIAVAAAIGMLTSVNAVHAALFLVINFFCVALFYLGLHAPFLAMVQITVYAGAIMVLFLFVIMLLGAEKLPKAQVLPWQRPLAIGLAAVLLVESGFLLYQRLHTTAILAAPGAELNTTATLQTLGMTLFSQYLLPFEVTSLLLLVAMVGAIVLTKQVKGEQA
jgi:NADH-quinone oxidoreductase subunit J